MPGEVRLLVGTKKGAFIYTSDEKRQRWEQSEPMLEGWQVFHMTADPPSDPPRVYAAANSPWWGRSIARSSDWGRTWDQRTTGLAFPEDMDLTIDKIWHVRAGHDDEPGVVARRAVPERRRRGVVDFER